MTERYFPGELEGNGFSKLAQVMKQAGYNKEISIDIGEVIAAPPNLKIKLKSDGLTLEKEDIILSQQLTEYEVTIKEATAEINNSPATITNFIGKVDGSLKTGERVLIISDDDTAKFFALNRVVQ